MLKLEKLFSVLTLVFLLLLKGVNVTGKKQNQCTQKCGHVHIQFPFYLRNSKLNHSTHYPSGFDLICTEKHETVLELPAVPIKLFVKNIDYSSQQIEVYDPQNCLSSQLLHLGNASVYPFHFPLVCDLCINETNVSFFHCNSMLTCPIFLLPSQFNVDTFELRHCTKVKDVLSVGWEPSTTTNNGILVRLEVLPIQWSKPDCRHCQAQAQNCRWKNATNGIGETETECFLCPTNNTPTSTILLITAGGIVGLIFLVLLVIALLYVYRSHKMKREDQVRIDKFLEDYKAMKPTRFHYADIKRITNGFKHCLGEGGHGEVFKGMLSQEIIVAVKILKDNTGDGKDFINEVGILGKIHHVNIVRLLGFCAEGFHRALVYDFFPSGSLQRFLAPPEKKDVFLGWDKLQQIALGVARGIEYLHLGCDHRILHFDINPHNVLLDDQFVPKITDFGLAKLCPKNQSMVSMSAAKGTLGYIAPEVFSRNFGNVSYKSDIYSYGMLLLEMVGGRKNTDTSDEEGFQVLYPEWIHNLLEDRDVEISVDDEEDVQIARKLAIVGLWCIRWNPVDRPSMKTVVQMLEGDGDKLIAPTTPLDITNSSRTNAIIPKRYQNLELEIIHEIED